MNLSNLSSCIMLLNKAPEIYEDAKKLQNNDPFVGLKTISIITRSALLFLGLVELGHTSQNLKLAEFLIRNINMPVEFVEAMESINPQLTLSQIIAAVEKKILGPLVALLRSGCETKLMEQKRLRDLPPEEQANVRIPIYEDYDEESRIVGYRPFVLEECLENIESLERIIPKFKIAEFSCQIAPVSKVAFAIEYTNEKIDAFTIFKIKKCFRT
ncbi:MAG: hypothetical protein H0U27_08505, partial [Nitrosopumilus sp.]|nr:hypothetical protein [Nitrosopumilus sp.]